MTTCPPGGRPPAWPAWVLPLILFALLAALAWPGVMTNDSYGWLMRARSGHLSDVQPVGMTLLWMLLDPLWPGPFPLVALNIAVLVGATAWLLRTVLERASVMAVVLVLFLSFPPVLTLAGIAWRDVTGLALTLLSAALTMHALERTRGGAACGAFAGVVLISALAALFRYNHAAGAVPFLAVVAWHAWRRFGAGWRRLGLAALCTVGLATATTFGAMGLTQALSAHHAYAGQARQLYLLARLSAAVGENLLPPRLYPDVDLAHIEQWLARRNAFRRVFWTAFSRRDNPLLPRLASSADYRALARATRHACLRHWRAYLALRTADIARWFDFGNNYAAGTLRLESVANARFAHRFALNFPIDKPAWSRRILAAADKLNAHAMVNNPLWLLLVAAVATIAASLRRRQAMAVTLLSASALLHFLGIALRVYAIEFRLVQQSIALAALAIMVYLAAELEAMLRDRRSLQS